MKLLVTSQFCYHSQTRLYSRGRPKPRVLSSTWIFSWINWQLRCHQRGNIPVTSRSFIPLYFWPTPMDDGWLDHGNNYSWLTRCEKADYSSVIVTLQERDTCWLCERLKDAQIEKWWRQSRSKSKYSEILNWELDFTCMWSRSNYRKSFFKEETYGLALGGSQLVSSFNLSWLIVWLALQQKRKSDDRSN